MNPNNLPLKSTVLRSFCYNVCSHLSECNNGDNGESCHFSTAVSVEYIVATNQRKRLKPGIFLEKESSFPWFFTMVSLICFLLQKWAGVWTHMSACLCRLWKRDNMSTLKRYQEGWVEGSSLSGRILQGRGQELLSQIIADLWSTGVWPRQDT